MSSTWIMVANSTVARFFHLDKGGEIKEIETLIHPESRLHANELVSDRPGRAFESTNTARHAMEPRNSPKQVEFENFARTISEFLEKSHNDGKFTRLCIASSPHFLGLIRQAFKTNTTKSIITTIDKDLTQMTPMEIREQMLAHK